MTQGAKDIHLWETWKKDPTPHNLSTLTQQMKPVIYRATQINQGSLPPAVIEAQAKLESKKAFETFDPKKGVKLSTHMTNYLQKVNRLNYKYQELFSVPENRRLKFTAFNTAKDDFVENIGREPSVAELADSLSWSKAEVNRFKMEDQKEFSDTQPHSSDLGAHDTRLETLVSYAYNDMSPVQQSVFDLTSGYNGSRLPTSKEIMDNLGMTQGQLSHAKNQVKKIIVKATRFL